MPVLKSLSFTVIPKAGNDPVQLRRAKFVSKPACCLVVACLPVHLDPSLDGPDVV